MVNLASFSQQNGCIDGLCLGQGSINHDTVAVIIEPYAFDLLWKITFPVVVVCACTTGLDDVPLELKPMLPNGEDFWRELIERRRKERGDQKLVFPLGAIHD